MTDSYSEAINLEQMERQLARCAALDVDHPNEACARKTVMKSICPCMMCEDSICNALTANICAELQ